MTPGGATRTALVDGTGADADALRALLVGEGWTLGGEPPPDVAFIDEWTPETTPWVVALRAAGTRLSCVADLVVERSTVPVVGVTGTAGKTTTSWLLRSLLTAGGHPVRTSEGRAGNLWPTCELLGVDDGLIVAELTSSHLCFMARSPTVAVVTSFWPDHVELHGSLEAYRAAKSRIARHQTATDVLVLPWDDEGTTWLRDVGAARRVWFADEPLPSALETGVFTRDGVVVARRDGVENEIGELPLPGALRRNALAAAAAATSLGVGPAAIAGGLAAPSLPPHRQRRLGDVGGVPLIDDTMAATPAKTRAALELHPDGSIVLVAGGRPWAEGGPVHSSPGEQALLTRACAEARRAARRVILFGEAADRLVPLLDGVPTETVATIGEAVARAVATASEQGADAVLVSPMFPLDQADRDRVAAMAGPDAGRYPPEVENEEER